MQEGPPLRVPPCSVDGWMETDHEVGRASMSPGLRAHLPGQTPHSGGLTVKRDIHTEANLKRENTYTKRSLLAGISLIALGFHRGELGFWGGRALPLLLAAPKPALGPWQPSSQSLMLLGKGGTHRREAQSGKIPPRPAQSDDAV